MDLKIRGVQRARGDMLVESTYQAAKVESRELARGRQASLADSCSARVHHHQAELQRLLALKLRLTDVDLKPDSLRYI